MFYTPNCKYPDDAKHDLLTACIILAVELLSVMLLPTNISDEYCPSHLNCTKNKISYLHTCSLTVCSLWHHDTYISGSKSEFLIFSVRACVLA